jgi:hypothetical protein
MKYSKGFLWITTNVVNSEYHGEAAMNEHSREEEMSGWLFRRLKREKAAKRLERITREDRPAKGDLVLIDQKKGFTNQPTNDTVARTECVRWILPPGPPSTANPHLTPGRRGRILWFRTTYGDVWRNWTHPWVHCDFLVFEDSN